MDQKILKNLGKLAFGALLIASIWYMVRCRCLSLGNINPAALKDYLRGFGKSAPLIYILAYALNTISIFPPIAVLSLTAGLVFGKTFGALYLMAGAMLGCSCTFFISRLLARGLVEKFMRGRLKRLDDLLERKGFVTVLFFRLVPLVPYEGLNYAAGLSKMRFPDYFLASFLGFIPGVIISAFFGGALGEVRRFRDLFSLKFGIAAGALIILILIPVFYRHHKKGQDNGK
jgi:uncharacterized membrane protein YdjX (TVP38/TMEM64 family)